MAENSAISWTDHTFNPWIGCTKVGPACDGCYAEAMMGEGGRFGRVAWGAPGKGEGTRVRTSAGNWAKVRKWQREAATLYEDWARDPLGKAPSTFVFCASLADVFDNAVPPEWRRDLFDLIRATPNLTWLLLTKRPGNIVKLFSEAAMIGSPEDGRCVLVKTWPRNAAIGCTVVTQEEADRDIPKLLAAKAALNPAFAFLSMEPLLGPVDLNAIGWRQGRALGPLDIGGGLDWIITGGETDQGGHKARPTHPDWFRSIRDQCAAAGVAYHHKQNGEWAPCGESIGEWPVDAPGHIRLTREGARAEHGWPMQKVGKAFAGRLLDGAMHDARPEVRRA